MKDTVILQDKIYISAKRVHKIFGYTSDYIGQLCRAGKLDATMVGRAWFVTEKSVSDYKEGVRPTFNKPQKITFFPQIKTPSVAKTEIAPVEIPTVTAPVVVAEVAKEVEVVVSPVVKEIEVATSPVVEATKEIEAIVSPVISAVVLEPLKYESESAPFIPELSKKSIILTSQPSVTFAPRAFSSAIAQNSTAAFITAHNQISSESISKIKSINFRKIALATLVVVFCFTSFKAFTVSPLYSTVAINGGENNVASISSVAGNIISSIWSTFTRMTSSFAGMGKKTSIAVNTPDVSKVEVNGMVVAPGTNSKEGDAALVQRIKDSFSDEVSVNPDKSGTSGVITPVFKKTSGDDFVYVLVPVQQDSSYKTIR